MKRLFVFLLMLAVSCSTKNDTKTIEALKSDSTTISKVDSDSVKEEESSEGDCVFNNDYFGLTKEWIKELKLEMYEWDSVNYRAIVPDGADTIYFTKGGCGHFGISFEFKLHEDHHPLTDSSYWINKSMMIAKRLNFYFFDKSVAAGQFRMERNRENSIWFDVKDDQLEDNLIYDGIEVTEKRDEKIVSMVVYYN